MSDHINTITVVLKRDIRDDDCEAILHAIRMVKGVLSAAPHVANATDFMAEERAKQQLRERLLEVLK